MNEETIRTGQIYQLIENPNNRLVIKCEQPKGFFETKTSSGGSYNISGYALKHYSLIAEYPSWQEAVNSKEFRRES